MRARPLIPIFLVLAVAAVPALAAPTSNPFKLKPGATGKACLACHVDFQDTLKKPAVHTPVKNGDCADCHDPHASDHGKLLAEAPSAICVTCHADVVPEKATSIHKNVLEGNCIACHDPHASANKGNLVAAGNELCLSCHKDLGAAVAAAKFKHSPVGKSCLTCHDPHAGAKTDALLAKGSPELCLGCHKPDVPTFQKAHAGYPVAKSDCGSCHDPHGSDQPSILWATVHQPVKNKMCGQCHNDAAATNAVGTRKGGLDLCRGCHSETINAAMNKSRIHWPVVEREACLNCHEPHAARTAKLLTAEPKVLCGSCHADAVARQDRSVTKHPPNDEGSCSTCHAPHASDAEFLFAGADEMAVCAQCHEWGKHASHPLGAKYVDPRNKNLGMNCSSCHRTHGSEFKHFGNFDTKKELCLQCHDK